MDPVHAPAMGDRDDAAGGAPGQGLVELDRHHHPVAVVIHLEHTAAVGHGDRERRGGRWCYSVSNHPSGTRIRSGTSTNTTTSAVWAAK